jgi:hypothetical protein
MESQAALVRTEGRVELNTIAAVDLWLVLVVFPDNTELDDSFRNCDDLESGLVFWVLFEEGGVFEG